MRRSYLLCVALLSSLPAKEASACIPPLPSLQLNGESNSAYAERARAFYAAQLDEDKRRAQATWYDKASIVSLARITKAEQTSLVLNDGLSRARRIEAVRLGHFKGEPVAATSVAMQDTIVDSCGTLGGGTATQGKVGDYIVTFENVQANGTGHVAMLLRDLREPRLIAEFSAVVQRARKAAALADDR